MKTKTLLIAGAVAGPLFSLVVVLQELTREGFDGKKLPLSMLSLGDLGWLQITNFVLSGLLAFAGAVGVKRVLRGQRGGKWLPILFGSYGVGLVWGGVFVADPAFGWPIGTPEGAPTSLSWHGILHGIAPAAAGVALVAACFVAARRFAGLGERGWAAYSVITAVAYVALASAAFPLEDYRYMLAGGIAIWVWAAVVTGRLIATVPAVSAPQLVGAR